MTKVTIFWCNNKKDTYYVTEREDISCNGNVLTIKKDNNEKVVIPLRNIMQYNIVTNCNCVIPGGCIPICPNNEFIRFNDESIINDHPSTFFRSEAAFYIFALNHTSGKERCKLLGIKEDLYHSKEKADKWKHRIFTRINPYYCKISGAKEACEKLIWFYKHMTDEE